MTDAVILALVAALMFFAVRGAVKHFKGESPCCGGGGSGLTKAPAEKRLDSPVLGRKTVKTVKISGMHCDHCVRSVTEAINKIDGASAKVSLKSETAVVSYDRPVEDEKIRRAVEDAGFQVVSIKA